MSTPVANPQHWLGCRRWFSPLWCLKCKAQYSCGQTRQDIALSRGTSSHIQISNSKSPFRPTEAQNSESLHSPSFDDRLGLPAMPWASRTASPQLPRGASAPSGKLHPMRTQHGQLFCSFLLVFGAWSCFVSSFVLPVRSLLVCLIVCLFVCSFACSLVGWFVLNNLPMVLWTHINKYHRHLTWLCRGWVQTNVLHGSPGFVYNLGASQF